MKISEIMTKVDAGFFMPIENDSLERVIGDRDVVIREIVKGQYSQDTIGDILTGRMLYFPDDGDMEDTVERMQDEQVHLLVWS